MNENTKLEQYRDQIGRWDWDSIHKDTYLHIVERNGELYGDHYLGTVFQLVPSGKHYTPRGNNNVTEKEAQLDELWLTALDLVAEHYGLFVVSREKDHTELFIVNYLGEIPTEGQMKYQQIANILQDQNRKKIRYKTYAMRLTHNLVGIRHHNTTIITIDYHGGTTLDCNGWRSRSTKTRLNKWLPKGYNIYQENHVWYLYTPNGEKYTYQDGLYITTNGTILNARRNDNDLLDLAKSIRDYTTNFTEAVLDGKVKWNEANICKPCCDWHPRVNPIPNPILQEHLRDHIEEQVFVPSLVFAAKRTYPLSIVPNQMITDIVLYNKQWDEPWLKEIARQQLTSSLRRTLYRALELGC